jgi:uncharacterized membrane protein YuzA (DUF378 family)
MLFTVRTIQNAKTHSVGRIQSFSILKRVVYIVTTGLKKLMLFREIVDVYCKNQTKHMHTLCGKNAEFLH